MPEMSEDIVNAFIERIRDGAAGPANRSGGSFDIGRELARNGLSSTLRQLIRDARDQVQQQSRSGSAAGSSSAARSGWNSFIMEALDGFRADVSDIMKDLRDSDRTSVGPASLRPELQTESRFTTGSSDASQAASDGSLDDPAADEGLDGNFPDLPSDGRSADTSILDSLSGSQQTQLTVVMVTLVVCGFCLVGMAFHNHKRRVQDGQVRGPPPVMPADIRNRRDIVRVFHWLTQQRTPDAAPSWWHHRQALDALVKSQPRIQDPLEVLAGLYETARYCPQNHPLGPEQIQAARTALARCLS